MLPKRLSDQKAEEGQAKSHDAAAMPPMRFVHVKVSESKFTCRHGLPPLLAGPTTDLARDGSEEEEGSGQESVESASTPPGRVTGGPIDETGRLTVKESRPVCDPTEGALVVARPNQDFHQAVDVDDAGHARVIRVQRDGGEVEVLSGVSSLKDPTPDGVEGSVP